MVDLTNYSKDQKDAKLEEQVTQQTNQPEQYHRKGFEQKVLHHLFSIERRLNHLMATVEEVAASVESLKADLEQLAAAALAEFAKLETEIKESEGNVSPEALNALKSSIDDIDTAVKGVQVPTT